MCATKGRKSLCDSLTPLRKVQANIRGVHAGNSRPCSCKATQVISHGENALSNIWDLWDTVNSKRRLSLDSRRPPPKTEWKEEVEQLMKFVLLSTRGDLLPSTKSTKFWKGASKFLTSTSGTKRTSKIVCYLYVYNCMCCGMWTCHLLLYVPDGPCHLRVTKVFWHRFQSPVMAENNYLKKKEQGDTLNESVLAADQRSSTSDQGEEWSQASVSVSTSQSINMEVINTLEQVLQQLLIMELQKQLHILKELFSNYASKLNVFVPEISLTIP